MHVHERKTVLPTLLYSQVLHTIPRFKVNSIEQKGMCTLQKKKNGSFKKSSRFEQRAKKDSHSGHFTGYADISLLLQLNSHLAKSHEDFRQNFPSTEVLII